MYLDTGYILAYKHILLGPEAILMAWLYYIVEATNAIGNMYFRSCWKDTPGVTEYDQRIGHLTFS